MELKAEYGVTYDQFVVVVLDLPDWRRKPPGGPDDREAWCGPCPIRGGDVACRVVPGKENMGDTQEVLMVCSTCNPHSGHLTEPGFTYRDHLISLGLLS